MDGWLSMMDGGFSRRMSYKIALDARLAIRIVSRRWETPDRDDGLVSGKPVRIAEACCALFHDLTGDNLEHIILHTSVEYDLRIWTLETLKSDATNQTVSSNSLTIFPLVCQSVVRWAQHQRLH
jgi:hypothetical protein